MAEDPPVRGLDIVPPEQELARRDPAFPGLGVLVDPELFCGLVRVHSRAEPGAGRLVDLRYRPGSEAVATYVFGDGERDEWVHARALGGSSSFERSVPGSEPAGAEARAPIGRLGFGRVLLEPYSLVVSAFPSDDDIPSLAVLGHEEGRSALLREVLPEIPDPGGLVVRTMSYDPGHRWIGRVEGPEGPVAALRMYHAAAFDRAHWNGLSLTSGEGLKLPAPLGRSREQRALAVAWARGRPLEHALFDPGLHRIEVEAVGAAVAELHAQEPERLPHCPPAGGAPALRSLASTLAFILPRCAPRARRLGERLIRRLVESNGEARPIHGNLHPGKALLRGGGRVVLLDVDRACAGPAARDAGTFLAHLERAALAERLAPERAEWASEAFLAGYDRTSGRRLRRHDVRLHTALALFELALRPFRRLTPDWPEQMVAILGRAEVVLGR